MIVTIMTMRMLSKTLAPCLDLLKGACLDCLESSVNFVLFFLFEIDVLDDGAPMEE